MQIQPYAEESPAIKAFRQELENSVTRSDQSQTPAVLHKPSSPEVLAIMKRLLQQ